MYLLSGFTSFPRSTSFYKIKFLHLDQQKLFFLLLSFSGQSQSRERATWTQKFRRREKQVEQQRRVKRLQRRRRFKHDEPCQNNIIYLLLIDFVTLKKYFKVWYKISLLAIYFRNETFRLYEHGYNIVNEQEAINYGIYNKNNNSRIYF